MADSDGVVDGGVLQREVLGVNEVIDAVARRSREVIDQSPTVVLLWNNTNARTMEIVVWGVIIGASHSILSNLFLEGFVYYLWVLKCGGKVGCCESCVGAMIANAEALSQGVHKLRHKVWIWVGGEESRKNLRS